MFTVLNINLLFGETIVLLFTVMQLQNKGPPSLLLFFFLANLSSTIPFSIKQTKCSLKEVNQIMPHFRLKFPQASFSMRIEFQLCSTSHKVPCLVPWLHVDIPFPTQIPASLTHSQVVMLVPTSGLLPLISPLGTLFLRLQCCQLLFLQISGQTPPLRARPQLLPQILHPGAETSTSKHPRPEKVSRGLRRSWKVVPKSEPCIHSNVRCSVSHLTVSLEENVTENLIFECLKCFSGLSASFSFDEPMHWEIPVH